MRYKLFPLAFILCLALGGCPRSDQGSTDASDASSEEAAARDIVSTDAALDAIDETSDAIDTTNVDAWTRDVATTIANFPQTLARQCVLFGSCVGDPMYLLEACAAAPGLGALALWPGYAQTDYEPQPDILQLLACANEATSCSSYNACVAGPYADYCTAHPGTVRTCIGNTLIDCANPIPTGAPNVTDCTLSGETCNRLPDGEVACGDGRNCAPLDDGGVPLPTCNANTLTLCSGSVEHTFQCDLASPASTCITQDAGGATCIPNEAPQCTSASLSSYCDGTNLAFCFAGRQLNIDCAQIGGTCVSFDTGGGSQQVSCFTPLDGGVCTPGQVQCIGTHLQVCMLGAWADVDCTSIGFRTCMAQGDAGAESGALCVM